jgi:hypothetical protein
MITMLLGGLWHGAGWTFVVWGALHGFYLVINHGWIAMRTRLPAVGFPGPRTRQVLAVGVTFLCVVVAWVFFRAADMATALNILSGMVCPSLDKKTFPLTTKGYVELLALVSLCVIVFKAPNSLKIMHNFHPALDGNTTFSSLASNRCVWKPTMVWAVLTAIVALTGVLVVTAAGDGTQFLYFQF